MNNVIMDSNPIIYSDMAISKIRLAGQASRFVREELKKKIKIGMSTKFIDDMSGQIINSIGGKSAFLGYGGYPRNICISLNDEIVHGIGKEDKFIKNGDLISIDVGVHLNGYIGDNAETFIIGNNNNQRVHFLIDKTKEALLSGIKMAIDGNVVNDISRTIYEVAVNNELNVVYDYVGHGCGKSLHEAPEIPNFVRNKKSSILRTGMVIAIEPMFNLGTSDVKIDADGYTVKTVDSELSAHFEDTILINGNKPEILTCLMIKK